MKIYILIGTRPNFIKVTRFKELAQYNSDIEVFIIHTGQHFDRNMSEVFFQQFDMQPDYFLDIDSSSVIRQFSMIMMKLEDLMLEIGKPDLLLVPGDVNSTLAGALTANKLGIKLAHLESGLRSFDRSMPEEINRILTDRLSDVFFVTEKSGLEHLLAEGVERQQIEFVGNTMIDTLVKFDPQIDDSQILIELKLKKDSYLLITLHRPSNVDTIKNQIKLISMVKDLAEHRLSVFPVHPRTKNALISSGLWDSFELTENLILLDPLGYFEFQKLVKHCFVVVTDSGGIQEETTFRTKPCFTLRNNTERPITIDQGSNKLLPFSSSVVLSEIAKLESEGPKPSQIPPLWDGYATNRIFEVFEKIRIANNEFGKS